MVKLICPECEEIHFGVPNPTKGFLLKHMHDNHGLPHGIESELKFWKKQKKVWQKMLDQNDHELDHAQKLNRHHWVSRGMQRHLWLLSILLGGFANFTS